MIREVSAGVLLAGYVVLVVGLAWLMGTRKTRRSSYAAGYGRGFTAGDREGYHRYAAEIDGSLDEELGKSFIREREKFAAVPRDV